MTVVSLRSQRLLNQLSIFRRFGRWVTLSLPYGKEVTDHGHNRYRVYVLAICDCGTARPVRVNGLISGASKSCGCLQREVVRERARRTRGSANPNWNGGRTTDSQGYVKLLMPEHPRADVKGYVLEQIVVAEKKYGHPISRRDSVHHIDGNPRNNHPDNLQLRIGPHGRGALMHCLDCGSENVYYKELPRQEVDGS